MVMCLMTEAWGSSPKLWSQVRLIFIMRNNSAVPIGAVFLICLQTLSGESVGAVVSDGATDQTYILLQSMPEDVTLI